MYKSSTSQANPNMKSLGGKKPSCAFTKRLLKLSLIALCAAFCLRGAYYTLSEGFSLRRIKAPVLFSDDLSMPPPSDSTLKTLTDISSQQFRYLKKGSQAYAFASEDGRYILKLFKLHHLQSADWLSSIPAFGIIRQYRDNLVHRRQYRIGLTLSSYKLAAEHLPDECALLYTQILPSSTYSLPITIRDAVGRTYTIDLAQHGFALQRRSQLVLPSFERWIKEGDLVQAKQAIDSLVALIARRSAKGIRDTDPDLHKNAGLLGKTAMFIDIGSFFATPSIAAPEEMKKDMKKVFSRFSEWLGKRSPELQNYLLAQLEDPLATEWAPAKAF